MWTGMNGIQCSGTEVISEYFIFASFSSDLGTAGGTAAWYFACNSKATSRPGRENPSGSCTTVSIPQTMLETSSRRQTTDSTGALSNAAWVAAGRNNRSSTAPFEVSRNIRQLCTGSEAVTAGSIQNRSSKTFLTASPIISVRDPNGKSIGSKNQSLANTNPNSINKSLAMSVVSGSIFPKFVNPSSKVQ